MRSYIFNSTPTQLEFTHPLHYHNQMRDFVLQSRPIQLELLHPIHMLS